MVVCVVIYVLLLFAVILQKLGKVKKFPKGVLLVVFLSTTCGMGLFVTEYLESEMEEISRNDYGEGSKKESLEVWIEGESEPGKLEFEVSEREYTSEEIQEIFTRVMMELDEVILGENESFDHVDRDLNLVNKLSDYPVDISWELDSYRVLNSKGEIREEHVVEEGTLVEVRGLLTYREEQVIYLRNVMVYPVALEGMEFMLQQIQEAVSAKEEGTRLEESFSLPGNLNGLELNWSYQKNNNGYYVLLMGIGIGIFLIYRDREQGKEEKVKRQAALVRDYPGMISKMTMLLSTGVNVKNAWERVVHNYENLKEEMGILPVYEEMGIALREMQGGIAENEAYERFGKRCELTIYMKFGALLSQNLRKGSKGLSELLRMEAIQSFENRKSMARRKGEEAGTKLLLPMMGMLAVVLILVMVPAFLTMQL